MTIDEQTEAFLERVRGGPASRGVPITTLRAETEEDAARFGLEPEPVPTVEETDHGRLYVPDEPRGIVVYAHGGGFVRGSVKSHDGLVRALANGSGCAVLSVAYRLAPEYPFPAALDDFIAAVAFVAGRGPIVVAGDGAGGNLAGASTLKCDVALQALIQPVLDLRAASPSIDVLGAAYGLPRADIEWSHALYSADPDDPLASPLLAAERSDTPGFVITGELDPFRDEGEAYATRAGIEHVRYTGLIHDAVAVPRQISMGERVIRDAARRIGEAFPPP